MSDSIDKREDEVRQSIADSQDKLEVAITQLKRLSAHKIDLGHYVASHPWHWLIGAGLMGALIGLRHHNNVMIVRGDRRWKR